MKKNYSDPLMFSNILLLTGPDIGTSETGGFEGIVGAVLSIGSKSGSTDVQIIDPEQNSETKITDSGIASVIEQMMQEDTVEKEPPSDDSSLAN